MSRSICLLSLYTYRKTKYAYSVLWWPAWLLILRTVPVQMIIWIGLIPAWEGLSRLVRVVFSEIIEETHLELGLFVACFNKDIWIDFVVSSNIECMRAMLDCLALYMNIYVYIYIMYTCSVSSRVLVSDPPFCFDCCSCAAVCSLNRARMSLLLSCSLALCLAHREASGLNDQLYYWYSNRRYSNRVLYRLYLETEHLISIYTHDHGLSSVRSCQESPISLIYQALYSVTFNPIFLFVSRYRPDI